MFYRSKPFDEERKPIMRYRKRYLKIEEIGNCLNQQSNVCVTRQRQLERMGGYQNLNGKQ